MVRSKEFRSRARAALKGKYWGAFVACLIIGLIASIGSGATTMMNSLSEILELVQQEGVEMDEIMTMGMAVIGGAAITSGIIGFILSLLVNNPLTIGSCHYFINNANGKATLGDILRGFKASYGRNILVMFLIGLKTTLWTLLFVIPGVIKSFEYAIIPYLLADNPEMTNKEAFATARKLMMGNKWRLFKLGFSFIGWFLLCILTLGIGVFFLNPYIEAAYAEFYREIKK